MEKTGKIIKLSERGELKQIKYSNRLDFVFYQKPEQLERFYESKRLMHEMINSDKYVLEFHLDPWVLLIMNNYRTLHGRTSYNTSEGSRWLQGLYIDHDSAESKYKLLAHGWKFKKSKLYWDEKRYKSRLWLTDQIWAWVC